jgi:hypothetical protein
VLDVHATHQSVHPWEDFFIHMATITIGLLTAISLEQTVEYLHHRYQAKEIRLRGQMVAFNGINDAALAGKHLGAHPGTLEEWNRKH